MEITLKNIWEWIVKGIAFILVVSIIFGLGGYVYSRYFVEPTYVASVKFFASGLGTMKNNPEFGVAVAPQYAEFLNVKEFYETVSKDLLADTGKNLTPSEIAGMLDFSSVVEDTSTFFVTVTSSDADLAYNVALSVADEAPKRVEEFVDEDGKLQVIENPTLPTNSVGTGALKNATVALILGFLLACVIVVIKEIFDSSIKTSDEITQLFGIPVFGSVPDFSDNKKGEK